MTPKPLPIRTTLAIARDVPIAVVCVVMKKGLSRLFAWNLETDEWTPGQFLTGEASIQDISSDGQLFSYIAHGHHISRRKATREAQAMRITPNRYVCIAKPPYFTALGFFPTSAGTGINFLDENVIALNVPGSQFEGGRLEPNCPWKTDFDGRISRLVGYVAYDHVHQRELIGLGSQIVTRDAEGNDLVVKQFEVEPFEAIAPPNWAKVW